MFIRILITSLLLTSAVLGKRADTQRIAKGDPLSKVYKQLRTPVVEFPLKGNLIQEYRQCTITSRDGVVLSVVYKSTDEARTEPDKEQPPSIQEIRILAEQGDAPSQYLLAYCLQSGQIVEQNYEEAVSWYTRAALQGHMPSQHNLGVLYMTGEGVVQNHTEAYTWALLAASNGNDALVKALVHQLPQEQKLAGELKAELIQSGLPTKQADIKPDALPITPTAISSTR